MRGAFFAAVSASLARDGLDDSSSRWSLAGCDDAHTIDHLLSTPELRAWLAYGPRPLTEMMDELGNCSTFSRGRFSPPLAPAPAHSCDTTSCTRLFEGRKGLWTAPSVWRPLDDGRPYAWYSARRALGCLRGRVLVFRGDSVTRNVFVRLVWWLRGLETVVSQPFHRHAIYTVGAAGDELATVGDADVADTAAGDASAEALLVERLERALGQGPDAASQPAVLLWVQFGDRSADSDNPVARLVREAERARGSERRAEHARVAGVVSGRFAQLCLRRPEARRAHPQQHWSTEWLDLDAMNAAGGAPHYVRRDFLGVGDLGTLVADPHANQSRHNPRFWPMPPHQRLRVTPFDDTHFQCAFSPMWPGKVAGWKMPPNGDCRDLLSLNAIQAMLGRICNSRIDRIGRH